MKIKPPVGPAADATPDQLLQIRQELEVYSRDEVDELIDSVEAGGVSIVNNLTSGGTSSALSAEQGKVLKTQVDGKQPDLGFANTAALNSSIDSRADARITAQKASANGLASLDAGGKLNTSQIPDALVGATNYQGTWNANTNVRSPQGGGIPTAAAGNKGHYYVVSNAGTTAINGESDWQVRDWIVSNGATWDKVDNTDAGGGDASTIRATPLTGLDTGTASVPTAADTILGAFGKLAALWNGLAASVRSVTLFGMAASGSSLPTSADTVVSAWSKLLGWAAALLTTVNGKAPLTPVVRNQAGSTYTMQATDEGQITRFTDAAPNVTIGTNLTGKGFAVEFLVGSTPTLTMGGGTVNGVNSTIAVTDVPCVIYFMPVPATANTWETSAPISSFKEDVEDTVAALLAAGTHVGITAVYSDATPSLSLVVAGALRGLTFTSSATTTDADPGNGIFRWNNATQASASQLFIDNQTADAQAQTSFLAKVRPGSFLMLVQADDATKWQHLLVTSAAAASGYYKLGVSQLSAGGAIAAAKSVLFDFNVANEVAIYIPLGDDTTVVTTGTAKRTIPAWPYDFQLTRIPRLTAVEASTSGLPAVDMNEAGVSMFSTVMTLDANETTSETAATPAVLSDSLIANGSKVTFDVDVAGTNCKGLGVTLYGYRV